MKQYEVIKRQVSIKGKTYGRGDKVSLSDDIYLSFQDSLKLLESVKNSKKSKKVKSHVIES